VSRIQGEALRLINAIYSPVAEPARWPYLPESLAIAAKAPAGLLRQVDTSHHQVDFPETPGDDKRFVQANRDNFIHPDDYGDLPLSQPVGAVMTSGQRFDPRSRSNIDIIQFRHCPCRPDRPECASRGHR
jgi:hypothetical protein